MTGLTFPQTGLLAGAPRISPWHWGCVVEDMQQAIDDWFQMGASACSMICRMEGKTYDAEQKRICAQTNDIAFLKLDGGRGVIELICPVGSTGTDPQGRMLAARPGLTHIAVWCDCLPETAAYYMSHGAKLVLAAPAPRLHGMSGPLDIDDLLSDSAACYLRLAGGQLVELNPATNHAGLPNLWGNSIHEIIPPPDLG